MPEERTVTLTLKKGQKFTYQGPVWEILGFNADDQVNACSGSVGLALPLERFPQAVLEGAIVFVNG